MGLRNDNVIFKTPSFPHHEIAQAKRFLQQCFFFIYHLTFFLLLFESGHLVSSSSLGSSSLAFCCFIRFRRRLKTSACNLGKWTPGRWTWRSMSLLVCSGVISLSLGIVVSSRAKSPWSSGWFRSTSNWSALNRSIWISRTFSRHFSPGRSVKQKYPH